MSIAKSDARLKHDVQSVTTAVARLRGIGTGDKYAGCDVASFDAVRSDARLKVEVAAARSDARLKTEVAAARSDARLKVEVDAVRSDARLKRHVASV